MRILDRYILKEMVGPTALGFGFYTFIILMTRLFDFAEMIIKRSLPVTTVIRLLAWSLPNIVVLTIPMSLLVGILIAVGRLSADSEIIAMRSSGISTRAIYRPVFYFTFAIFVMNFVVMNLVVPRGNHAFQGLRSEIVTSAIETGIRPRVFFSEYENLVLYVNDIDSQTGQWKGVFISDSSDPENQRIILAASGQLSTRGPGRQVWVDLQQAQTHVSSVRKPARYDLNKNAAQRFLIPDKYESGKPQSMGKSFREYGLLELIEFVRSPRGRDPIDLRVAQVEIHKKFAIPFACLAFGLVGLPLGITNRGGGKSSGFSLSIAIILVYYIFINNGEDLAQSGKIPPALGMWAPNLLISGFGIYLMARSGSEKAARPPLASALLGRVRTLLRRRKPERPAGREELVPIEQPSPLSSRLDIAFPNILDRYVIREFLKVLLLVMMATTVLFLIVDYTEIAGDIGKNSIPFDIVLAYYRYFALQLFSWTLPVSILVATLVTFGLLSKNNEITALKANGVSLYRVAVPIVGIALVASLISYFLLDFVLPYSNQRHRELRDQIKGKARPSAFSVQQRQWRFGEGRSLFNFLSYTRARKELSQVQVFELDQTGFRLIRRVFAERARFDGTGWVFEKGWIRSFGADGVVSFSPFPRPIRLQYRERPEDFEGEVRSPEQMTYLELRRYIASLRSSGYAADELAVELYKKTSWPFICVVMALIALPFAFRIGKRGALYGIGIALFLAFVYWTVFGIFTKFGEVGNLPAMLSAWSANILFAIAALYLFLRVET